MRRSVPLYIKDVDVSKKSDRRRREGDVRRIETMGEKIRQVKEEEGNKSGGERRRGERSSVSKNKSRISRRCSH